MRKQAVAAALSGVLLAGCTGGDSTNDGQSSPDGNATSSSDTGQSGASGQERARDVSFGDTFEFDDDLAISVSAPKLFRPSANATTGGEPDYVRFEVRLENQTPRRVRLDQVSVTVESGGGQGGDVIDERKNLSGGSPSRVVKPGGAATWALGFGVLDPDDVTVQVQVGGERQPVTVGK
jgi:hypothetical protein